MAGIRFWSHGTTVTFNSVDIEGIESIEVSGQTTEEVEVTDNDSGGDEELLAGLRRGGLMTLNCRQLPGSTGQDSLRTARGAGTVAEVVITLPASATDDATTATMTFDAFVTEITNTYPQVSNEPAMVNYTFKVTGGVTEAVA